MSSIFYSNLQRHLLMYTDLVQQSNSLGLFNDAVDAENLFCAFLNQAFGWKLSNANQANKNQDSFDLTDKNRNLFVQVTSNKRYSSKVKDTVAGFKGNNRGKKKSRLIILFISKKCPKNILKTVTEGNFTYEGYDISKLLEEVYYSNKIPSQLKKLNLIFQSATAPVIINSTFPEMERRTKAEALPVQPIPINKKGIFIERKVLIEDIFGFGQTASGILTGGPGAGKSVTIAELQKFCYKKKVPCFIIRINELLDGTDEELNSELKTGTNWISALKKIKLANNGFKGLLIFDAFDTAKDERLKTRILKQIKNAITDLKNKWNILVSARTFDAIKSPRLLELFPQTNPTRPVSCRCIEISELSEEEFNLAIQKDKKVLHIVRGSTDELKALLKIPYFFKLLEQVVHSSGGSKKEDLVHIETEEQLLNVYWNIQVASNTKYEVFLRSLTLQLAVNESLSCAKSAIISDFNSTVFDDLSSLGIIVESSVTKQNISFNHNILLEFAVSKYLIPETVNSLVAYINEYPKTPFLFRQSFVYFYSKLWKENRNMFWEHYFEIRKQKTPLFRLYHQTILNYILAGYYKTPVDFSPIFGVLDLEEQGNTLKKILEGIRFISKENMRSRDFLLFFKISESMNELFLWELGFLIDKSIKSLQEDAHQKTKSIIAKTALNYLSFVLQKRKTGSNKPLVDGNGGYWGIQNVCSVFPFHKKEASRQIKQVLELLKEPEFPIRFFLTLSKNLLSIFEWDKKIGLLIYEKLYYHSENSDKETFLGNSVVTSLKSNRRQDFGGIHYQLERDYKKLLALDPSISIPLGIGIANQFSLDKKYKRSTHLSFTLNVNGIKTKLTSDFSFASLEDDKDYGPISHIKNIFDHLDRLITEGKEIYARNLVNIIVSASEATGVWRQVFKLFTRYPKIFKKQATGLLANEAIYACNETVFEAGELIKALWEHLSIPQKKVLEGTIVDLTSSRLFVKDTDLPIKRIQRLLSCFPAGKLLLARSKDFMRDHTLYPNRPLIQYSGVQPYNATEEEKVRDMGVDASNGAEMYIYKLIQSIEPFNSKFDTNNTDKPGSGQYEPLIPVIKELFGVSKTQQPFSEQLQFRCDYEVSRFANLVARNGQRLKKGIRIFIEEIASHYILDERYKVPDYETGSTKARVAAYSPTPRTVATQTFVRLLYDRKSATITPLLLQLMSDKASIVRFTALHAITYYWHHQRDDFWEIVNRRSETEKDGLCINQLIQAIWYDNIIKEDMDKVEHAAMILLENLKNADESAADELWRAYAGLILRLVIKHNSKNGEKIIYSHVDTDEFVKQLLTQIIRDILPPRDNDYIANPAQHNNLIEIIHAIIVFRFNAVKSKGLKSDHLDRDFVIIDNAVVSLYFSFTDKNKSKTKGNESFANKVAYFNKIKPLLGLIADESNKLESGFMVAHTGYYFIQLLNLMLDADPGYILSLASSVVKCAAANNFTYDSSTLGEVVKLTEKILADHKVLLSNPQHFQSLITILDLFTNSGWQEALELTWRLKEIF